MRVLYFGTYERDYPRNAQVISCLRRVEVEVDEHHMPVWDRRRDSWHAGAAAAARLAAAELRLLKRPQSTYDSLIVGYPGVFNPLVSLADTFVADRGRFRPGSPAAWALAAVDRLALRSADVVVADTHAHADHLAELAGVPRDRVEVAFVGAEDRLFMPGWSPEEPFTVLFVGKLIPLHGFETILAAARAASELRFRLVGSGQLDELARTRPQNVDWVPWVEYERLPQELRRASCALGIFGTSAKAQRVIPNKAFQALACGTPLVTGDTPGARELLVDGESALLVPPGDAEALAHALRRIAGDPELAGRLSAAGRAVYDAHASEDVLGRRWRELLEGVA